jgi:hypothetical protein
MMLAMVTLPHQVSSTDLDTMVVRQIAVDALADPRTVRRVLRGQNVRGHVGERIRARLAELGMQAQEGQECARHR